MEIYRWFWGILTISVLTWYSTITLYIAYRGIFDIQHMLKRLGASEFDKESAASSESKT